MNAREQNFSPDFWPSNDRTFICADLNGHSPAWDRHAEEDDLGRAVSEWCDVANFMVANTGEPTRQGRAEPYTLTAPGRDTASCSVGGPGRLAASGTRYPPTIDQYWSTLPSEGASRSTAAGGLAPLSRRRTGPSMTAVSRQESERYRRGLTPRH